MKGIRKEDYLHKKIIPFNPKNITDLDGFLSSLKNCGFQGKNLGIALDILHTMASDKDILTVLTLSGAMVPAGMGELICTLIENHLIDIIVTTGANISHDIVDAFTNVGHYLGSNEVDDEDLFGCRINRIYNVFLPEENYKIVEKELLKILQNNFKTHDVNILPSDFLKIIGENIQQRCILSLAAEHDLPIFVPAFTDSEFALDLLVYSIQDDYNFNFDILGDVKKYGEIIRNNKKTGTIIIGGGVPRNWAQQIFPLLDQLEKIENFGFDYSVRIHTAVEYDGGLSGCTISESKSWGKYGLNSNNISVWCDATIAFPILITGLLQRLKII